MTALENRSFNISMILPKDIKESLCQCPVLSLPEEVKQTKINKEINTDFVKANNVIFKKKHHLRISIPKERSKKISKLDDQTENSDKIEFGWCYGACMKKGQFRQVNEDRFSIFTFPIGNSKGLIAGVYDGFESNICSNILSDLLIKEIISELRIAFQNESTNNEISILKKIFQNKCNVIMKKLGEKIGGSTCILTIIVKQKIFIINVGDSFACLINKKESQIINTFHNTNNEKEVQHIMDIGGIIFKVGGIPRIQGELSITRAIGNHFRCKEFISSEPDIYKCEIDKSDAYLLLGTDGLLNHFNKEEIHKYIFNHCNSNELELAEGLVNQTFLNGTKDNVTALVINLRKLSEIS